MGEAIADLGALLTDARSAIDMVLGNMSAPDEVEPKASRSKAQTAREFGKQYLAVRKSRDRLLGQQLSDSAWLILIDVYVHEPHRDISVSSACIASGKPPTTALRHIRVLGDLGLIDRYHSPTDGRVVYIRLTDTARRAVEDYLCELDGIGD